MNNCILLPHKSNAFISTPFAIRPLPLRFFFCVDSFIFVNKWITSRPHAHKRWCTCKHVSINTSRSKNKRTHTATFPMALEKFIFIVVHFNRNRRSLSHLRDFMCVFFSCCCKWNNRKKGTKQYSSLNDNNKKPSINAICSTQPRSEFR